MKRLCLVFLAACTTADLSAPESKDAAAVSDAGATDTDAARAIAEADIIQLAAGRLYALSTSGTLTVIDVSAPAQLTLLSQTTLQGVPFELYLRGEQIVVMTRDDMQARVVLLDATGLSVIATHDVTGELADSRIVGDVLYLATYANKKTILTSLALPSLQQADRKELASTADTTTLAWGQAWRRSIYVTDKRLYVGGHTEADPITFEDQQGVPEGIIDVFDITDPSGKLTNVVRLQVAGAILNRWQMDERDGILRVVSQPGAGRVNNGLGDPRVVTIQIHETKPLATFEKIGGVSLKMPRQEGLRSVRFDGDRAYVITYARVQRQTGGMSDPLFIVDLADPTQPAQKGELEMPGFVYHMEAYGDRLLAIGVDETSAEGSLNVSLFDVKDADKPAMIQRVSFAPQLGSDEAILAAQMPEEQDRIQKAFRVIDQRLIVVPFSDGSEACANGQGGVQLIDWSGDTLSKRTVLPLPGNPRRAFENNGEIVAVSDSTVRAFSTTTLAQTAELTIGECSASFGQMDGEWEGRPWIRGACSASPSSSWLLFAMVAFVIARRRLS